jgi:DNA-binding HxlR family transcriptional regulator
MGRRAAVHSVGSASVRTNAPGRDRSALWGWKFAALLLLLGDGPRTYSQLWSMLPGITPQDLSEVLRELEAAALVVSPVSEGQPTRYALSRRGIEGTRLLRAIHNRLIHELERRATAAERATMRALFDRPHSQRGAPPDARGVEYVKRKVMQAIRQLHLQPGDRVPSARGFAYTLSVSVWQVEHAYRELIAQGVLEARERAGTFVANERVPSPA